MSRFRDEINLILTIIKRGNVSKLQDLYELTYSHLKLIALKYAVDKNDWEDILIEAYSRVYKYINSIDVSKDGYNWLCKIVQNVAYDFNKKFDSHFSIDDVRIEKDFYFTDGIENENLLITEILKLSEYDQKLLYLRFWEDKSYSEIAKIVDSKKSTVHKKIYLLIKQIGENLNK